MIFLRPVVLKNSAADNDEAMKRIETLDQKELVKQRLDPSYIPKKPTLLEKVLN